MKCVLIQFFLLNFIELFKEFRILEISIQLLFLLNLRISVILDFDYTPFSFKIQPFLYFLPASFCFLVFFKEWPV